MLAGRYIVIFSCDSSLPFNFFFSTANSLVGELNASCEKKTHRILLSLGAYEYLTKKANGRDTDISRLFIYYNARVKDQGADRVEDYGCSITNAIEALSELGTCLESVWPYNISDVNKRPNDQAYQEGAQHRITSALRLDLNLNEMKSCLAQGFPFAFGLRLYASFDQAKVTSVVPMPNVGESSRESHKTLVVIFLWVHTKSNDHYFIVVMQC